MLLIIQHFVLYNGLKSKGVFAFRQKLL